MKWILLLAIFASGDKPSMIAQEFDSKAACDFVAAEFTKPLSRFASYAVSCVPKGDGR